MEGRIDPLADLDIIETELMLADMESLEKRRPPLEKKAKAGSDKTARVPVWGPAQLDDYLPHRYHQPSDQYTPDWDVRGALDDLTLYYEVGNRVAHTRRFPRWYPNSEFRVSRDRRTAP